MSVKLKRTKDEVQVFALHRKCFPDDYWDNHENETAYWLAMDGDTPVGFASCRIVKDDDGESMGYLTRAGVLKCAQGQGLQRRFLDKRCAYLKKQGCSIAITYTVKDNYPSITNLIRCGFRFYEPFVSWAGEEVFYFKKEL